MTLSLDSPFEDKVDDIDQSEDEKNQTAEKQKRLIQNPYFKPFIDSMNEESKKSLAFMPNLPSTLHYYTYIDKLQGQEEDFANSSSKDMYNNL